MMSKDRSGGVTCIIDSRFITTTSNFLFTDTMMTIKTKRAMTEFWLNLKLQSVSFLLFSKVHLYVQEKKHKTQIWCWEFFINRNQKHASGLHNHRDTYSKLLNSAWEQAITNSVYCTTVYCRQQNDDETHFFSGGFLLGGGTTN